MVDDYKSVSENYSIFIETEGFEIIRKCQLKFRLLALQARPGSVIFKVVSNTCVFLSLPYLTRGRRGTQVPALILKIRIFATNTVTATKYGDFS